MVRAARAADDRCRIEEEHGTVTTDRISILAKSGDGAAHIAARLAAAGRAAYARDGRFVVAVSPGALTAEIVDALVAPGLRAEAFWSGTHLFWTDTCFAGCDAPRSRARGLAGRLPVTEGGLRLDVADRADPLRAAAAYEQELRAFFSLAAGDVPRFDFILLAVEHDGRIAGLAREGRAIDEIARLAVADFTPATGRCVVTLTPPVLRNAAAIVATSSLGAPEAMRERLFSAAGDLRRDPVQLLRSIEGEVAIVLCGPTASCVPAGPRGDPAHRVHC
jgi:6-phosphogluconolactonase